jgi:hypothetical protein
MIIKIELPNEMELTIKQEAAAAGQNLEDFVRDTLAEKFGAVKPKQQKLLGPEGFSERLDAWVKRHPVLDHVINDDRESFYEGRE